MNGENNTAGLQYDRVDPRFETTGGFSAQDLETVQANGRFFLAGNFNLSPYFALSRDNLQNTKAASTRRTNPGLGFDWKLSETLNLTGGLDSRGEKTDDDTADNNAVTLTLGAAKNYGAATAALNYERGSVRDKVSSDQDRDSNALSLNVGGGFELRGTKVSWDLQERVSAEKHVEAGKSDLLLAHAAGLGLLLPRDLEVRARVALSDSDFYVNANDASVAEYSFSASKKLGERLSLFLDYARKDSRFAGDGDDYSERKLNFRVSCRL
jgi:hypothetical protein